MKKSMLILPIFFSSFAMLASCSTTTSTVYPMSGNQYQIVSLSDKEASANDASIKKAREICSKDGKQMIVLKSKTAYQGINKETASTINFAAQVFKASTDHYVANSSQDNDYRNILTFKCK